MEEAFLRMYDKLRSSGIQILEQMLSQLKELWERQLLWSPDMAALNQKTSDYRSQDKLLTALKQQGMVDPEVCLAQSNRLAELLRKAKKEKEQLLHMDEDTSLVRTQLLLDLLRSSPEEVYSNKAGQILLRNLVLFCMFQNNFRQNCSSIPFVCPFFESFHGA